MANEARKVEGEYEVHDFCVATGTTISGSTLCVLSDPRTAAASTTGLAPAFAGITATDFKGGQGKTQVGLYTKGIFVLTAADGANISVGEMVVMSGANLIKSAAAGDLLTGAVVGKALEAIATNTTGEVHVGASA